MLGAAVQTLEFALELFTFPAQLLTFGLEGGAVRLEVFPLERQILTVPTQSFAQSVLFSLRPRSGLDQHIFDVLLGLEPQA